MAATNIAYRNGRSIAIRAWDGGWTRETSWTDYAADGTRRAFSVTESSDSPGAVTNRVSYSDFLGRTVAVLTPGAGGAMLVTTNIYDGATPRLIRTETTGQPATTYLHDALGNTVASVRSGITSATETRHEIIGGNVWRVDTGSTSCGGVTNAVSTTRRQLTGLSDALRSQTVSIAPNGSATTEQSSFDPQTCELTTMRATDAATPYITVSRFGRHIRRESPRETVFNYFDQMGRAAYSEACHPATGEPLYWRWSQFDGSGNEVNYGTDYFDHDPYEYLAVTGARTFDAFNRETSRTDALGNTVTTAYDALGRPVAATGATYPVGYEYDTAGRMTAMSTTRDGTSWDATYWNYDHATGLATGKTYADGSAVSYAYTPDGKPLRTTWARDAWKENAYSTTGLLTGVSYSDDTPVVSLGYDAFQHLASASNAVVAYAYMNSALGTATNETVTLGGTVSTLARGMDYRHRLASLCVGNTSPVQYWYDVENRLSTVSTPAFEAEYAYTLDGWDSGHSITLPNGTLLTRSVSRNPYRRQLINSITNSVNGAAVNPLAYNYDKLSRVTSRNSGTFDYNDRSEITNAIMGASLYAFLYDAIGNRISSSVSAPLRKTFYTANQLNQYTEIRGAETNSPAYDADGNLLTNGVWSYAWDAENRLIAAYSNTVCVVSNAYDHLSRRVIKITTTQATYFVWDNWNIVAEIAVDRQTGATNLTRYAWGLDISGTLQGAGGIGGLLAVQMDDAWYFPFYDNNGNITDYVNAAGMIVAHYEYSPFGEIVAQSGTLADTFAFRFSTKYQDSETGLVMYQLRPYSPLLGRWLCHDPIREEGGENIYCFVSNDPLSFADPFGLWSLKRLNTMSDYYATILDADFRSLRDVVMPDIQAEIDRVLARAEALPKQCQYRAALIEGLERVKRTLDKIDLLLKSGQPLNLGLKGYYGSPGPDPWSARVWKSWGIWEMEFNLGDGLYFPKDYKYRLGTLLHEHVHIVEGNNQHKGFWNNPYVIDTMVKNSFESFSTDVRSKMIVEEGDKCCPKGHEEWPNNP
jgi:RHS repeat-associated protein